MIWVVTQDQPTRSTLVPLIAAKGYEVSEYECSDMVMKRLQFATPAVIILDCGVSDSFEMLARLRSNGKARRIPVVMFSIDDQNLMERALLTGADAYVPKGSLDWAELLTEVVRFAGPPAGR